MPAAFCGIPPIHTMAARFLNADLEISGDQPLDGIRDEIMDRASVLHCGLGRENGYLAVFEIDDETSAKKPEFLIQKFCDVIDTFTAESRALWFGASRRVIDLGYEADEAQDKYAVSLSPTILARMAALHIALAFTVYPPDDGPSL